MKITERSVLLRPRIALPRSLVMRRGEFVDGWDLVPPEDARRLEKTVRKCGWHFIRIAEESRSSGVGESPLQGIACALKLALRSFGQYFNAVEVRHIRLTTYPWFVLCRVSVYPYRIEPGPLQVGPNDALPLPAPVRWKQLAVNESWLLPEYGREMPMFKNMPIASSSAGRGD